MEKAPQSKPLRTVLAITGMMCGHCEKSVREALEAVPGVASAFVDLGSGRATVTLAEPVGDETLIAAVEDYHFSEFLSITAYNK